MIPLKTNRRVLTWFCVYPPERYASQLKRFLYKCSGLFAFAVLVAGTLGSIAFIIKNISIDLENSLFALMTTVGNVSMVYMVAATYIIRRKIVAIFDSLTKIYNERKHSIDLKHYFY